MDSTASPLGMGNPAPGGVPRLNAAVKLNFGVGQVAEGVKTCSFSTFLLFYYNQVLGLSGDLAGAAIALALIFDAVTDPIAGSVSDRWRGPRGRRHPFMYASAAPLGVSFFLLFAPWVRVDEVGQSGLFAWMLLATILTRASMTLYHVPHMALGAELSEDYDERTLLVAIRHFFGAVGYILVYALGFGVFLRLLVGVSKRADQPCGLPALRPDPWLDHGGEHSAHRLRHPQPHTPSAASPGP